MCYFCSREAIHNFFLVICVWHIMQNSKWCDQNPLLTVWPEELSAGALWHRCWRAERKLQAVRQFRDEAIHRKLLLPLSGGTKVKGRRPHQTPGQWAPPETGAQESHLGEQSCCYTYTSPFLPGHPACTGHLLCSLKHSRVKDDQTEDPLTQDQSCIYGRFSKTLMDCNL